MDSNKSKLLVTEINKIVNKNYNILSFDLLQPEHLLQVLSTTLAYIEGSEAVDIQQESLEDTVLRILEMLRILKYKLSENVSPSIFRQGLAQGDKKIIHPILDWLITNADELKKRSYLAQYLVKIDIPTEFASDPDIAYLYEQYEKSIDEFKSVHKESELLKDSSTSVAELKSDIKAMEAERESVTKKIDKLKRQVEMLPHKDRLLEVSRELRLEGEKRREMMDHELTQQSLLAANEQKHQRLTAQLQELRQNSGRTSPSELVHRLEEECRVNSYLAQQKLPSEIRAREEDIRMYTMVLNEPSLTRAHLDDLNFKIQQVSEEVNQMMQSHLSDQTPGEDKNAPFRQQAAILARKKEAKAEELSDVRNQLAQVEQEMASKQKQLSEVVGDTVLRGEDLKKYVGKLRLKGAQYKKHKAQLAALKTESGILTRTVEILSAKDSSVPKALSEAEGQGLAEVFGDNISNDTVVDGSDLSKLRSNRSFEEISKNMAALNREIAEKKSELEPLIAELRPLREKHAETNERHEQLKKMYDSTASGLENSTARLEQDLVKMEVEYNAAEEEIARLEKEIEKSEADAKRVDEEVKLYISGSAEDKKNSMREILQQKIAENEKVGKQLKDEQAALKDVQTKNAQQVRYWKDLERLFKCKLECLEDEKRNAGVIRRERGAETLILPQ